MISTTLAFAVSYGIVARASRRQERPDRLRMTAPTNHIARVGHVGPRRKSPRGKSLLKTFMPSFHLFFGIYRNAHDHHSVKTLTLQRPTHHEQRHLATQPMLKPSVPFLSWRRIQNNDGLENCFTASAWQQCRWTGRGPRPPQSAAGARQGRPSRPRRPS